jgi:hypothetical protein
MMGATRQHARARGSSTCGKGCLLLLFHGLLELYK